MLLRAEWYATPAALRALLPPSLRGCGRRALWATRIIFRYMGVLDKSTPYCGPRPHHAIFHRRKRDLETKMRRGMRSGECHYKTLEEEPGKLLIVVEDCEDCATLLVYRRGLVGTGPADAKEVMVTLDEKNPWGNPQVTLEATDVWEFLLYH